MHRYRTLSTSLSLAIPKSPELSGKTVRKVFSEPWSRCIYSSRSLDSYKNISEILNVTTTGKDGKDPSAEDAESRERVKEAQSKTHFSGPGGATRSGIILGIETSADDTGAAVVSTEGKILGEALNSQLQIHLNHGGIIPPIAKHLHEQHIARILREAMGKANVTVHDLDAIATTVKPGLSSCLLVGLKHGKNLCTEGNKPFIPVNHMKAHALTCRMHHDIKFPYMVLLVSGGHCLLTIAKSIEEFHILGTTIDDAPGEAFDKTARRLKLTNLKEGSSLSGGAAIEYYATKGNPEAFQFPTPMYKYRDCNWSFSGLKFIALRHILREERKYECEGGDVIPTYADICASFQHAVVTHLCKKIQRGMIYADIRNLIPDENKVLVVSGGVASNQYIRRGVELVCQDLNYKIICPEKELCTDNGIMIAWNGVEKWKEGIDIIPPSQLDSVDIEPKCPIGESLHPDVRDLNIKCKRINMSQLYEASSGETGESSVTTTPSSS